MQRRLFVFALALVAWTLAPDLLFAAEDGKAWPPFPINPDLKQFEFGPGHYLATWKIVLCWLVLACWVFTTDWISRDCSDRKHDYSLWNSIAFFVFATFFILVWLLPWFIVSFVLLLAAYLAPLVTYIVYRNARAEPHEKVLTKDHLRAVVAGIVNKLGGNMAVEKRGDQEQGPDAQLMATGAADERQNNINLINARQSPGFLLARTLMFDAVSRRADGVRLDLTPRGTTVQYQIDGVWHNYSRQEAAEADMTLAVMKTLANLSVAERVKRQLGAFGAEVTKQKFNCKMVTQGTETGEVALIQLQKIEGKKAVHRSLEQLGMRPKMQEQLLNTILGQPAAFFIVSAPPAGGGLTTNFEAVVEGMDRFMRNFAGIEDVAKSEREIENVPITTYNGAAGETPDTILPKLIRTYPDAFVVRDPVNAATLDILCDQVKNEKRLVITSTRAKDAIEALLRVMALKVDRQKFAGVISGSLNVRLVRKLCDKCREGYAPPPELLKQMGLPPGRIEAFYRPPSPPPPNEKVEVCQQCAGVGYYGRTGIFELLEISDEMRPILAGSPTMEALRAAARKNKHRTLQEEGLLLVAKGITSVPELARVLKG